MARKASKEVLAKLKQYIVEGKLRPNQRLIETELAKMLRVSRTPVREALRQLEILGYTRKLSTGGNIVTDHRSTDKQLQDLYEIREALETMAIRLVCQRVNQRQLDSIANYHALSFEAARNRDFNKFIELNDQFHTGLYSYCGNKQLYSLILTFRDQSFIGQLVRSHTAREFKTVIRQHQRILESVCKRNVRLSEKAVQQHLRTALDFALGR